ncbi:polyprenyl synthetase family protein [Aquihabitans sp. McL0605]|uniref:polyprenyl synthetase family protein n=1 Tax=Aquihabitans sp. McL0605 TaxID=3415671 RepID=UPI003CF1C187
MAGPASTSDTEPLPADLGIVASRVEGRVTELLDQETGRWAAVDPDLLHPLEALRALVMAGGKRLRPVFCHWGFVAAGGAPDDQRIIDAGAAFELLQAFALIHDDVMDGSATRRGEPAVHRRFADRHGEQAWAGESRRFGEGVAILAGDLALVYADVLIPDGGPELAALWHELRIELNIGQYLDLAGTATGGVGREGARRIARLKSGRYTIERPLQLGALLGGDAELAIQLSTYGDPLGEAFQLRDDVLGVFGLESRTGKPVGDDLREGKPTLMLAVAHERAHGTDVELLARVGDPDLDAETIAELQALFVSTGALDVAEAEITALAARAVSALPALDLPDHADLALRDLADFVVARTT